MSAEVKAFKDLYEAEFGESISLVQAEAMANRLIRIYKTVLTSMNQEKLQNKSDETRENFNQQEIRST